jgi:hypothetical protein
MVNSTAKGCMLLRKALKNTENGRRENGTGGSVEIIKMLFEYFYLKF